VLQKFTYNALIPTQLMKQIFALGWGLKLRYLFIDEIERRSLRELEEQLVWIFTS
jgi:hypothetical protein